LISKNTFLPLKRRRKRKKKREKNKKKIVNKIGGFSFQKLAVCIC